MWAGNTDEHESEKLDGLYCFKGMVKICFQEEGLNVTG